MEELGTFLLNAHVKKIGKLKVRKNQNLENEEASINETKMQIRRNFKDGIKSYTPKKITLQMKKRVTVKEAYYSRL